MAATAVPLIRHQSGRNTDMSQSEIRRAIESWRETLYSLPESDKAARAAVLQRMVSLLRRITPPAETAQKD